MEEEKYMHPVLDNTYEGAGAVRYLRDAPPAHYSLKIDSFSKVVDLLDQKFESATFSASGYTWRLVLYPNGNGAEKKHISLYLAFDKTIGRNFLAQGWEAHVTIKMFVYNYPQDKYLTIQDDLNNQIRRFHRAKREQGFDRLIPLDIFKDAANGYLVDDSCVFGVEVFSVKHSGEGQVLRAIDNPVQHTFNWKLSKFSRISSRKKTLYSEQYVGGDHKWRLVVYPKGDSRCCKDYLSLYLKLDGSSSSSSSTAAKIVLADFSLVIKNQSSNDHREISGICRNWFKGNDTGSNCWGYSKFMLLSKLKTSGFIVKDSILVEAKVTVKAQVTTTFS